MDNLSPSERIELQELKEMDDILKILNHPDNINGSNLSKISGIDLSGGDNVKRNHVRKLLERIANEKHHAKMYTNRDCDMIINDVGIRFLADGKSYVAEFLSKRRNIAETQKEEKANKNYIKIDRYIKILTFIIGIITAWFAYRSYQQNEKIEKLEKRVDNLEMKTKLKLPIIK